jgi:hypothetical protein
MRAWLLKQKKKDEKAAVQAVTPVQEATPALSEVQPVNEDADKPTESIEQAEKTGNANEVEAPADRADGEELQRTGSEAAQPQEVRDTRLATW